MELGPAEPLVALVQTELSARGYRQTTQRSAILRAITRCPERFSTEELLQEARLQSPHAGYATVNRTLRLLVRCALACARLCTDGVTRYELTLGARAPHDYLVCDGCGLLIPFRDGAVEILQERIARSHGFRLDTRVLELNGLCTPCRELARAEPGASVAPAPA